MAMGTMWDFRNGRDGTLIKVANGEHTNHIHCLFQPTGSMKKYWITNVPRTALQKVPPGLHPEMPKNGLFLLLCGATPEDSIVMNYLKDIYSEMFINLNEAQTRRELSEAVRFVVESTGQKTADELLDLEAKKLEKMRKAANPSGFGDGFGGMPPSRRDDID